MDRFTVALFGHRRIDDLWLVEKQLAPIVKELLRTKPYVSFLVGRRGEFDECAASVIRHTRRSVGAEDSEMLLALPYAVADVKYYEDYYDAVLLPE